MKADRKNFLLIWFGAAFLLLLAKLFYIQIVDDKYKTLSDRNTMVFDEIYAPRGLIYDRNGEVLVDNNFSYDMMVLPREVQAFDTTALASILDTTVVFLRNKLKYYRKYRTKIGFRPQCLIRQIPSELYLRFAEVQYRFPGFYGHLRSTRRYPFNAGGNLLGYVSEVDASYLKAHPDEYHSGDLAGKTGIEAAREVDLRGQKGYHILLRDSRNRVQTSYRNGEMDVPAVPGKDIVTTIDAHLQQYGQELMKGKRGSLIAIEPSTGEILTMVSSPGIDVDQLADIGRHYKELMADKNKPMFNRAVQASYPPGSVFKLVNGLIGLQEGVLQPGYRYPCNHGFPYGNGHRLGCHWHTSPLDLPDAIATSCNGYFCYVFRNILDNRKYPGIQDSFTAWREMVMSFGFGHKLGSDFPSELGGNIPSANYYNRLYGKRGWKFSTIVSLSIGQGEIGATPLQIANLCATVANRGYYYIPHLVKKSKDVEIDPKYYERQYTKVDTTQFHKVIGGMYKAVNGGGKAGGTAFSAAIPGLDICGKTGTAQNPHGKDNSVFICFAPMDNPRIAVAAYIENSGFGATWACPIASLLIEKYLTGTIRPERLQVEEAMKNTVLIQ